MKSLAIKICNYSKLPLKNPGVAKKQWLHFWGDHNGYDRLHKFFLQWVGPIGDMAAEFDKVDRFSSQCLLLL